MLHNKITRFLPLNFPPMLPQGMGLPSLLQNRNLPHFQKEQMVSNMCKK